MKIVGIDSGGTFTDVVRAEGGRLQLGKVPSTPSDPARAVTAALAADGGRTGVRLRHGTTVATNALLERKGARTALVTNCRFEDLLEIGRQNRPELYSLYPQRPASLVPPELRFGVPGRLGPNGVRWASMAEAEIEELVRRVQAARPEAIAVLLLHSYANPLDERRLGKALARLGVPVSLSSDVLPRFREVERGATTLVNAYLRPKLETYLRRIDGLTPAPVLVMQSSGGVLPVSEAATLPVRLLLSGPAAGVLCAKWVGEDLGIRELLSFDMGGTSTDVALVDGPLRQSSETVLAGLPIALPMVEIHTIGAGGGSIAHLDRGGRLRVGPESAGADPGPACYGRSELPTVTDANLVLGRLPADLELGGTLRLDGERSRRALHDLGRRSGLSLERTAEGIVQVVNAGMEQALRVVSVRRGVDPRPMVLVAFGGAGPLHAAALAEQLQMRRVLVPALAGALSALGLAVADQVRQATKSLLRPLGTEALIEAEAWFEEQEERLRGSAEAEGFRTAELRYRGQSFELEVPFSSDRAELEDRFHQAHEARYGTRMTAAAELVHVSLRMVERSPEREGLRPERERGTGAAGPDHARVFVKDGFVEVPRLEQSRMASGEHVAGPAVVTSSSATGYVPEGWTARSDEQGHLWIER